MVWGEHIDTLLGLMKIMKDCANFREYQKAIESLKGLELYN